MGHGPLAAQRWMEVNGLQETVEQLRTVPSRAPRPSTTFVAKTVPQLSVRVALVLNCIDTIHQRTAFDPVAGGVIADGVHAGVASGWLAAAIAAVAVS